MSAKARVAIRTCIPTPDITAIAAAVLMVVCVVVVGTISLDRQYVNVDTETDFLGAFMLDAERLTRGQPLLILYHPPAYSVALALANRLLDDWLKSGLFVSLLSLVCVLLASYELFRRVGGGWAALGSLLGLAVSDVFLTYGAQATSDMPFLALWTTSLALTAAALDAGTRWRWVAVGFVAGLGLLTRSNGILLVLLVLAPFLSKGRWWPRVASSAAAAAGLAVPISMWIWLASVTGSPVTPTQNYENLAYAYPEIRITVDSVHSRPDHFTSEWQVIAHDPLRISATYLKNLVRLPKHILTQTTWPPVAILGAAMLPLWLLRIKEPKVVIVLVTVLAGVLLTNIHPVFEARYYLFLVPLLGASTAYAIPWCLERLSRTGLAPAAAAAGLTVVAAAGLLQAAPRAQAKAEAPAIRAQLAEAVAAVRRHTPADATLVAYKRNLAFHTQRRPVMLPSVATIEELCVPLERELRNGPVYVYLGYAEQRRHRVELSRQLLGDQLPPWLAVTAEGKGGGGWRLLAVQRATCGGKN